MFDGVMKTGQVVGVAHPHVWVQVGSEMGEGIAVLVVAIVTYEGESDVLDLAEVGGKILEELKRIGRESLTLPELDRRVLAIESPLADVHATVGVAVQRGTTLMISSGSGITAYLRRGGTVGVLHSGGVPSVSGQVQPGDVVSLTTDTLVATIGAVTWRELLDKGLSGLEELAVLVHGSDEPPRMATVMGEVRAQPRTFGMGTLTNSGWIQSLRGIFDRPLTVRTQTKRINTLIGTFLLILLFVGIVVGMFRRQVMLSLHGITTLTERVGQQLVEAESVADINAERASYLLLQSRNMVAGYLSSTSDEKNKVEAEALYGNIDEAEARMFRRLPVDTNILIELSVLSPDLAVRATAVDEEGNALLSDADSTEVVGISLDDRSSWKVSGGPYIDMTEYEGDLFGLKADGVYTADAKDGGEARVIEPDELWGDPAYIGVYGGNVYVLDRAQGEIWKYPVLSSGFGDRRRWLGAGITLDFTYVADMFIDGDIWIVTSSGKLERYSRGVPVNFSMEGFPYAEQGRLASPTSVITSEEKVYVLEPGAKRVVVFSKESGKYEQQYVNDLFVQGNHLLIAGERGYVVTQDQIVWFQL